MSNKISIIGAGIGGLTLAITLKQRGLECHVYEASSELRPVGAGIIIANNAMQVFKKLGLDQKISAAGNKLSFMKITDAQLKNLSVINLNTYEQKYGVHNIAIHRGELQKILVNELGLENISLSKRLARIENTSPIQLTFEDGSSIESDVVFGADGIKSIVRNQLWPNTKHRNAHQYCWRGICEIDLPEQYHNELNEAWGQGKRIGFVKIGDRKVYWFALSNNDVSTNLVDHFSEFHPDILEVIRSTKEKQIIASEIQDLVKLDSWHDGNVCLIGDAAHATTPNLGQGACQAIEDAYAIGKLLDEGSMLQNTFDTFEKRRRKKVNQIVNTSWMLGKIAHWENPFMVGLRNGLFRMTPESVNNKQVEWIYRLD
jgi:2-polyprenyl-6-methoxyphenol hydroxylase-like FAD-dependent oxidoreductase